MQIGLIHIRVCIVIDNAVHWNTRRFFPFQLFFCRIAEYHHCGRKYVFRQFQQITDRLTVFPDITDITAADSIACCSNYAVLSSDYGICGCTDHFAYAWSGYRKSDRSVCFIPFSDIWAEQKYHLCLSNKRLVITKCDQSFFDALICNVNDGICLLVSSGWSCAGTRKNIISDFLRNLLIRIITDGFGLFQ